MNIYGQSPDLLDGGEIKGDLKVDGDVDVTGTLTATTIITETELEVKDVLITCGVDNPSDSSNLGLLEEYTSAGKRWAGLVRSAADKKQYLIKDATIKPTPTSNITTLPRANLAVGGLDINDYTLPPTDGTPGQVITTDGIGGLTFENPTSGNLQAAYDLSTAPQIQTTALNPILEIKNDTGADSDILRIKNISGDTTTSFNSNGEVQMTNDLTVNGGRIFATNNPDLTSNDIGSAFWSRQRSDDAVGGNGIKYSKSRGAVGAETAVIDGDYLYEQWSEGHDGTQFALGTLVRTEAAENWTPTNHGGRIRILTTDLGTLAPTTKMLIGDDIKVSTDIDMQNKSIQDGFILAAKAFIINNGVGLPKITTNWTNDLVEGDTMELRINDGLLRTISESAATFYTGKLATRGNLGRYDLNQTQMILSRADDSANGLQIIGQKSRGNFTTPTAAQSQDLALVIRGIGNNGNPFGYNTLGEIRILANENQTLVTRGGKMEFAVPDLGNNPATVKLTIDDDVKVAKGLVIGEQAPASNYTLPSVRATASKYVLMDVNGDGVVTWEPEQASSETLQQAFNVSGLSPQITTLPTFIPVFGIQSHVNPLLSEPFFELQDSAGSQVFEVYSDGSIYGYKGMTLGAGNTPYNLPDTRGNTESPLRLVGNNVIFEYGGYSQINAVTVPNNNTIENVITTSGAGSLTIPGGTIRPGSCFHIVINGVLENQNSSANIRLRVKANGTVIGDSNIISLDAISTLTAFEHEWDLKFNAAGVSHAPNQASQFTYYDAGQYKGSMRNSILLPIDTTIDNTLEITWQWSTASLANNAYVRMIRITKEF